MQYNAHCPSHDAAYWAELEEAPSERGKMFQIGAPEVQVHMLPLFSQLPKSFSLGRVVFSFLVFFIHLFWGLF